MGGVLERRRLLDNVGGGGGGGVIAPPTPIVHVYPSKGNTLTISSLSTTGRDIGSRSGIDSRAVTVSNTQYDFWNSSGLTTSALVNMTPYDTIYSTKSGTSDSNMVWCYVYCPDTVGAVINARVKYILSDGSSQDNLSVTTSSSGFISLAISNSFANMSGGTSPNNGNPYLDTANLSCINVTVSATKDGAISLSKSFDIYIQNTTISLVAPTFTPAGNTYLGPQNVTIDEDSNYSGQYGFYTLFFRSQSATTPPANSERYNGNPVYIWSTCYLNAKSFLDLGNGTVVESSTTSQLYTISNPVTTLLPPVFRPNPGNFTGSVNVSINNPNSSPTGVYKIWYTMDGSTPAENGSNSIPYTDGSYITITDTTTFRAIVVDSSVTPHTVSDVSVATYTNEGVYHTNIVTHNVNSDTPSTCGDFSVSKSNYSGNSETMYGFSIGTSNKGSVIYFTTDGTTPTTSSQSISNGMWYYITRPNTTLVKYLVVAPYCADVSGEFWILVNKAIAVYEYSGRPFLLGPVGELNWYSDSARNYSETSSCYVYYNGNQLDPADLSVQVVELDIDGDGVNEEYPFLKWSPGAGTTVGSTFSFVYAYSAPVKNWNGMCPYSPFNVMNGINGTDTAFLAASNQITLNTMTGPYRIYFSSNEIDTMCCAWMRSLFEVYFNGIPNRASSCSVKPSLEYGAFEGTAIESIDLTPCTNMRTLEDRSLAGTIRESAYSTTTALTNVLMPMWVSYLGDFIFGKSNGSYTRRPMTVTFYSSTVPSVSYNTFREFNESSNLIGNTSTIVVSYVPNGAIVCNYEDKWHYHIPRAGTSTGTSPTMQNKTDMDIIDQDGLHCGEYPPGSIPVVVTGTPVYPTTNGATISGNSITSDGGFTITQRGVCYSTAHNPVYWNSHVDDTGSGTTWNTPINTLQPSTIYYVRAFARNEAGVGYGEEKTFTTVSPATIPTLTYGHTSVNDSEWIQYGSSFFRLAAKVLSDGGSAITERKMFVKYYQSLEEYNYTSLSDRYPTPTEYDWYVDVEGNPWIENGVEYFECLFDYTEENMPSDYGWLALCIYAKNSIGWSNRSVSAVISYSVGETRYPTIELFGVVFHEQPTTRVDAIADVTCGTYGDVIVETYVSTVANAVPGDSTVVGDVSSYLWNLTSGTSMQTINSNGEYGVRVSPCNIPTNTIYYLRARARQLQNDHWVYSHTCEFIRNNAQAGDFEIQNVSPHSSDAVITAQGLVTSAKPYYGIIVCPGSVSVPTINNRVSIRYGHISGNSQQNITYTDTFNGLTHSTTYKCRSFLSNIDPTSEYADISYAADSVNFTTLGPPMSFSVKGTGNIHTKFRYIDSFNLSFQRKVAELQGFQAYYGWGVGKDAINTYNHFSDEWDYVGNSQGNISGSNHKVRDLFGWGTSSQPHRNENYDAWSTDNTNTYKAYDNSYANLTGSYGGTANWGWQTYRGSSTWFSACDIVRSELSVQTVYSNGLTQGDSGTGALYDQTKADYSRPLTTAEMNYLLFNRQTTSEIRFCKGRIDLGNGSYRNGLILVPDDWDSYEMGLSGRHLNNTNNISAPFSSNTIPSTDFHLWSVRFLPAAGYRNNKSVYKVNEEGWYWLNESSSGFYAYCLFFSNTNLNIRTEYKYLGMSVRLFSMT